MEFCRKTILLLVFSSFMSVGWGQFCDENMFWTDCGLPFDCNPTCSNPNPPPDCLTVCEIGCFCNEGYIFSNDSYAECILIEDCTPDPQIGDECILDDGAIGFLGTSNFSVGPKKYPRSTASINARLSFGLMI